MGGMERGPQGLGPARMGLPGEEIAETEDTPYENDSDEDARGLPAHESDADVAGSAGGGLMSSGGTASDYGRPSGEAGPSSRRDQDDDLTSPNDMEDDATGGFLAGRGPNTEEGRR